MQNLQKLVQSYLESDRFNLLDVREGFVVADKLLLGSDRDTLVLWIPPPSAHVADFRQLERRLIRESQKVQPQYPDAKLFLIPDSLEGFSKEFLTEFSRSGVRIRVPIQFFDADFRWDMAKKAASAIAELLESARTRNRVRQPYRVWEDSKTKQGSPDLLQDLFSELTRPNATEPRLRVVVGAAGAGKTILFETLLSRLHEHFHAEKRKRRISRRPIPLIPEHMSRISSLRTEALIDNFLRTDVATPLNRQTFEWMLVNGFVTWLFDGLDELYLGDPELFQYMLELVTRPETQAQITIWARSSLLTSCEAFTDFLKEFPSGSSDVVEVYLLDDWNRDLKRTFAWLKFEGGEPAEGLPDSPQVSGFLNAIEHSPEMSLLSSLPYYCDLLADEFKDGKVGEVVDEFSLMENAVRRIVERELAKEVKLLRLDQFEPNGLDDWLESLAVVSHGVDFRGLSVTDVEDYARLVLREGLPDDELNGVLTSLIRFPLFAPGAQTGVITFKHDLIVEYLVGRNLIKQLTCDTETVARNLSRRRLLADSLIMRYMATQLPKQEGAMQAVKTCLKEGSLPGVTFGNFLQVLLLSTPSADVVRAVNLQLEFRDLSHVEFRARDLQSISFRNSDLSNTIFEECNMQGAQLEGAVLSNTRFNKLSDNALRGASFGDLGRFEYVYANRQRIDDMKKMRGWVQKVTGIEVPVSEPCAAAEQLRVLFLKFVNPMGQGRRDRLPEQALLRGKRIAGAPAPELYVKACQRFGYLQTPDFRKRINRASGEAYGEIVNFVRDFELTTKMRQLLNSLCQKSGCEHVPTGPRSDQP